MTKGEFKAWAAVTEGSRNSWTFDEITYHNRGELLYYRGGESGTFISIEKDGKFTTGTYEGAIPHVGEASFQVTFAKQFATQDEAYRRMVECLGAQFLLETICRVGK